MKLRAGVLGLLALAAALALLASGSTLAQAETRVRASSVAAGVGAQVFGPSAAVSQLGNGQSYGGNASVPILAAEGAEAPGEAGTAASAVAGEAGVATGEAGAAKAGETAGEGAGDAAAGVEKAASEAGSGTGQAASSEAAEAGGEGGVTLFRAVGSAEAKDIVATGTYRIAGNSAEGGKYFFPTVEQAQAMVERGWAERVTSGVFPREAIDAAERLSLPSEGPGLLVPKEFFPFGPVQFLQRL